MSRFPINLNGEGHDPDAAEADAPVSQEAAFLQMVSQRYPEADEQQRFGVPIEHYSSAGMSNQTLEHALAGLAITGPDARQNPLMDTQWSSQAPVQTQGMNADLYGNPSNAQYAMEFLQINQLQRSNSAVNESNWYDGNVHTVRNPPVHMPNNGFLNGNLGGVPYFPRNSSVDQWPLDWPLDSTNGLGPGINGLHTSPPVPMLNNGFLNEIFGAVPYPPRNPSVHQWPLASTNGHGPGINGSHRIPPLPVLNNGFLNGNLGAVPYSPRNTYVHRWPLASTNGHGPVINGSHRIPPVDMLNNDFLNGNLGDVPYLPINSSVDQRPLASTNGRGLGNNGSVRRNGSFQRVRRASEILNGSIVFKAKSPMTSPLLQNIIEQGFRPQIDMIFNKVSPFICDLMVDPVAHNVIQKLLEKCSFEQINKVLDMVLEESVITVGICVDSLGTRAIQSLLKCLQSEEQISRIVEALSLTLLELATNSNAKHVILLCFTKFSPSQNRPLFEEITKNCCEIAIDQHGCCMLQHCIGKGIHELTQLLLSELIPNALNLSVDNYGNYVVQYLMELEDEGVICDLISVLNGNYAFLAQDKYGSHTVQKLLRVLGVDSMQIVHELLDEIKTLIYDPYGNYVIQTAWDVSQERMRMDIIYKIVLMDHIALMRCNKHGKKVLDKIGL